MHDFGVYMTIVYLGLGSNQHSFMNHAHRKNPYKYYLVFILVILLKRQAMQRGLREVSQVHGY